MRKLIQQHEFTIPTKQTTYPVDVFNMRSIKMLNSDKARLISSHKEYNEISLADQQNPRSVKLLEDFVSYTTEQLFSLTNISGGHIYTSGSQSNLHALYQYRNNNSYSGTKKILTSNHGHTSIVVAADMLGLELLVAYSPKEYYTHIKKHHESIAAVVITAGTTQLGQIEEMDYHLENLCQTYNIPIHIDAAYGGCNLGYHPRYNQQLTHLFNRPSVQSITIDFHKFVGENEVSLLLFRQGYMHKQSDAHNHYFLTYPSYHLTTKDALGPYLTRTTIDTIGHRFLMELSQYCVECAQYLETILSHLGTLCIQPVDSSVVPVELDNHEEAKYVHYYLLTSKKLSTSLLKIDTDHGRTEGMKYGIRVVITPDVYYSHDALEYIAESIFEARQAFGRK